LPLECGFIGMLPAPVLFAGLIPGIVGVYQVVLRAPSGLSLGDHEYACSAGGVSAGTVKLRMAARPDRRRRGVSARPGAGASPGAAPPARPWSPLSLRR